MTNLLFSPNNLVRILCFMFFLIKFSIFYFTKTKFNDIINDIIEKICAKINNFVYLGKTNLQFLINRKTKKDNKKCVENMTILFFF